MKNFFKSLRLSFLKGSKLSEEKALELLLEALLKKEHEQKNKDFGHYNVKVNNTLRYNIKKTSGNAYTQFWEVIDLLSDKKYKDFISLSECKDFINEEIFSSS